MTKKAFKRLAPKHQKLLKQEVRDLSGRLAKAGRVENAEALRVLESQGVKTAKVTPEGRKAFTALAPRVAEMHTGKLYPAKVLKEVRSVLASGGKKAGP